MLWGGLYVVLGEASYGGGHCRDCIVKLLGNDMVLWKSTMFTGLFR